MNLTVVTTDPVQEIAAEPATLEALTTSLRASLAARIDGPLSPAPIGSMWGFPLVTDPDLPPGEVHMRPTPGAPPPPTAEELAAMLAYFAPRIGGEQR